MPDADFNTNTHHPSDSSNTSMTPSPPETNSPTTTTTGEEELKIQSQQQMPSSVSSLSTSSRNKQKSSSTQLEQTTAAPSLTSNSSMEKAAQYKEYGNVYFASHKYTEARDSYRSGLQIVAQEFGSIEAAGAATMMEHENNAKNNDTSITQEPKAHNSNNQEQKEEAKRPPEQQQAKQEEWNELEVALRSNLAIVLLRLEDFQNAQEECSLALKLEQSNPKVWYRRALAREGLFLLHGNSSSNNTVVEKDNVVKEQVERSIKATTKDDDDDKEVTKHNSTTAQQQQQQQRSLVESAMSDLSICLELFPDKLTKQQSKMKAAAQEALERCTLSLEQLNQKKEESKEGKEKEVLSLATSEEPVVNSPCSTNLENSLETEAHVTVSTANTKNTTSVPPSHLSPNNTATPTNTANPTSITTATTATDDMTQQHNDTKGPPSPSQQRQDVIRLLMSRQMQAEQQQQQQQQQQQSGSTQGIPKEDQQHQSRYVALDGEAYFLLNWNWWKKWCHHVDFFYTCEEEEKESSASLSHTASSTPPPNDKDKFIGKRQRGILRYLPPGASIPTTTLKKRKKNNASSSSSSSADNSDDDDNSSTSSSSSLDSDHDDLVGPIDNGDLIFSAKSSLSSSSSHLDNNDALLRQWGNHNILRVDSCIVSSTTNTTDCEDDSQKDSIKKKDESSSGSSPQHQQQQQQQQHLAPSLRPNLVRGYHYEILPREVYNALRVWYGEVTPSICRRSVSKLRHTNNSAHVDEQGHENTVVVYDADEIILPLYYNNNNTGDRAEGVATATSPSAVNPMKRFCGACGAPDSKARCTRCLAVHYCDRTCQESHWTYHKGICKKIAAERQKNKSNNNNKNHGGGDLYQSVAKHGHMHSHNPSWGRVGLNNLGNTCFMNSAVQCLSHSTPLTRYFLSNKFKADLNATNPLGTGGKLANAYQAAMKDIWMMDSGGKKHTCISPTTLKRAIAMFAPRFAGCSQHDTQEFLAYLLDGLHEDLNRIKKAPYVEMPDVTDGQNMAIAGAEAWDAHLRRNDSLVMDTFYGQFKSTCVCPKCNRVSVSFDAFNHISLEIPQQQNMTRPLQFLFVPSASVALASKGGSSLPPPTRYGVTVRRNEFIGDARRALSELCRVPPNKLAICDVYEHAIYEILQDGKPISTIRPGDILVAFEVDAYTNTTIHAIATNIKKYDGTPENDATEKELKDKDDPVDRLAFGYPFLTSFHAGYSCKQVYDHLWNQVRLMVGYQQTSKKKSHKKAFEKRLRNALHVRVVDNSGKPRPLFSCKQLQKNGPAKVDPDNDGGSLSAILPSTSNEKIAEYLGKDCTEQFLFIHLEWDDEEEVQAQNERDGEQVIPLVNPEQFLYCVDHPSLAETIQKHKGVNASKGVSLEQCFDMFTRPERLDENNKWYCSTCKEHVRAMKTMELWRLPNILVVHLKRFEFKHSFRRDKLDTLVNFPLESLDMSRHCAKSREQSPEASGQFTFVEDSLPAVYDLFGVTNHYGRMGFGHYTAFARKWDEEGMSRDWALFDDSSVRSVGDGQGIISPAAYVLFYRRRDFT